MHDALELAARLALRRGCLWTTADDRRSQDFRDGVERASSDIATALRAAARAGVTTPPEPSTLDLAKAALAATSAIDLASGRPVAEWDDLHPSNQARYLAIVEAVVKELRQ